MSSWALDLGTTNSALARFNAEQLRPELLELPELSRRPAGADLLTAPRMVPSVVHLLEPDLTTRLGRLVLREVAIGASLGMVYGIVIALLAPLLGTTGSDPFGLGLVITLGMMGSMIIAAAVGTSAPLILHRLNIDPAIATGPFVTTSVDILGLLFYFWLATVVLKIVG